MKPLSGLQKQVLASYRACFRHGKTMPLRSRIAAVQYIRSQFRDGASLDRMDIQRIEFLLRQCKKKLSFLVTSEVSNFEFISGKEPTLTEKLLSGQLPRQCMK